MRLVTVGTGTISLTPGRACASHLVDAAGVRLLLDCGSGAAHGMSRFGVDWWGITHVALTHFHADHVADLPTLIFAWRHARLPGRSAPLEIVGPVGTRALLDQLAAALGEWVTAPGFPLTVREVAPEETVPLGDEVALAARKVPHTEESVAYSVTARGRRVTYTGDTGFDLALGEWAAGSDVLLCECSLPEQMAIPTHLTPEQCGEIARVAAPGLLVLTHLYPPLEAVDVGAIVRERFSGPVVVAHDGWSIELEDSSCW